MIPLKKMKCRDCGNISISKEILQECLKCKSKNIEGYIQTEQESLQELLKLPNIFKLITEDELNKQIVGELESRKSIFLAAQGRLVENCQTASYNLLVNDDAGTGKDYVTNKTLEIIPKESYVHKTRISPTVFTYWHNKQYEPEWTWDGKVFYPEDISETVLNSDVFKVMCSSGSSATIVIRNKAVDIEIDGKPVMITTTAKSTPNPELTRRFMILNLDSSENQTEAIMKRHSEYKMIGIVPKYNEDLIQAQALLNRVKVRIPFADLIDKHFPKKSVIMRTLYPRFLDYIAASTAFHQYQRRLSNGYYISNGQDYDIAREVFNKLTSNRYMIPLTKIQKRILEIFENQPKMKLSASQTLPLLKGEIGSLATMIKQLNNLLQYGLLSATIEKDSLNRDMEVYSISEEYKPKEKLDLPEFKALLKDCKDYELSNDGTLIPVVFCNKRNNVEGLEFFCKYCQEMHRHGKGEGHRSAHCKVHINSPYHDAGYILKLGICNNNEITKTSKTSEITEITKITNKEKKGDTLVTLDVSRLNAQDNTSSASKIKPTRVMEV